MVVPAWRVPFPVAWPVARRARDDAADTDAAGDRTRQFLGACRGAGAITAVSVPEQGPSGCRSVDT